MSVSGLPVGSYDVLLDGSYIVTLKIKNKEKSDIHCHVGNTDEFYISIRQK